MADFGNAGKLTIRTDKGAVMVKAGQHIHYCLTVSGATPIFTFVCEHKPRLSAEDFGPPKQTYEWDWRFPADADAPDDTYVVAMSFLTALKYTLRAELRTANDNMLSLLKDFDAESNDAHDKYPSSIEVIAQ
jgi:hypothetical protein